VTATVEAAVDGGMPGVASAGAMESAPAAAANTSAKAQIRLRMVEV
jgi:hypothetical protein